MCVRVQGGGSEAGMKAVPGGRTGASARGTGGYGYPYYGYYDPYLYPWWWGRF